MMKKKNRKKTFAEGQAGGTEKTNKTETVLRKMEAQNVALQKTRVAIYRPKRDHHSN